MGVFKMKVTIMCGISGAGKSTYIKKHYPNTVVFAVDNFLSYDEMNVYKDSGTLQEAYYKCLRAYLKQLPKYALNDEDMVVDNANTTITGISPYVSVALAFGFEVEVIMIKCDPETAYKRNKHNVSWEDIQAQYERLSLLEERWSSWWPKIKVIGE